jgi:integrase
VIASLAEILANYRACLGNPASGPMFPGPRDGKPAGLNNTLNRIVKPALTRCQVCRKTATDHARADHEFKRDKSLPLWHGWHAFRRGLATNLHDLKVDDKTIQAILRHSDVSVTQRCDIKTLPKQSQAAMNRLETEMFAECASGTAVFRPSVVN